MGKQAYSVGALVLTTHERSGYFSAVLGDDVDMRFNPRREPSLEDMLHNTALVGGRLAVVDEAFFLRPDDMALGLERFVGAEKNARRLKIIVVCSRRNSGDELLAFLVMYCGIYNIIYGKSGSDLSLELARLMRRDNTRSNVLHLAESGRWKKGGGQHNRNPSQSHKDKGKKTVSAEEPLVIKEGRNSLFVNTSDGRKLSVQIEIKTIG